MYQLFLKSYNFHSEIFGSVLASRCLSTFLFRLNPVSEVFFKSVLGIGTLMVPKCKNRCCLENRFWRKCWYIVKLLWHFLDESFLRLFLQKAVECFCASCIHSFAEDYVCDEKVSAGQGSLQFIQENSGRSPAWMIVLLRISSKLRISLFAFILPEEIMCRVFCIFLCQRHWQHSEGHILDYVVAYPIACPIVRH